uniref:Uncharacterized protein n=1 Tax=Opuntia streptacantha TaxID=393608 RepID=A0A7C9B0P6_OPUST
MLRGMWYSLERGRVGDTLEEWTANLSASKPERFLSSPIPKVLIPLEIEVGASTGSGVETALSSGAAFLTNGCSSSWAAVGRLSGFRCKHNLTNSFPSSER